MNADELLEEVRQVFREELEDHLATLEREVVVLGRAEAPVEARRAALDETFRAAHSLKGAARAAAYPELEEICHALETTLASAQGAQSPDWTALFRAITNAHEKLRRSASDLTRSSGKSRADVDTVQSPADAPSSSHGGQGGVEKDQEPPLTDMGGDSVRVPVSRLGQLFATSEELVAIASRARAVDARALEEALDDLAGMTSRARQLLRSKGDVSRDEALGLLERSASALETARLMASRTHADSNAAWREAHATATSLVERVRDLRVVPFESLRPSLERAALDAADESGKRVVFRLEGRGVDLDRRVRDGLREPLLHLVRNAVDHGIDHERDGRKAGTIEVRATLVGKDVRVVVSDDGRGIDREALAVAARARGLVLPETATDRDLLVTMFEPGVTTRAEATELSGRGVGLDVVRERTAAMHGRVEVESASGKGTTFTLTVPLDLSVVRALVVITKDASFALVTTSVERLLRVSPSDVVPMEGGSYVFVGDSLVPLADLDVSLGLAHRLGGARLAEGPRTCVVIGAGDRRAAFRVDSVDSERDIVVRPLGGRVRRAALVTGATILEGGEVVPVLDVAELVRLARPASIRGAASTEVSRKKPKLLLADDSVTTRHLVRAILESAGYDVLVAQDGEEAWQALSQDEDIDLVVSDIDMPRMDGLALLARIRATPRSARLPVVLVTALDRDVDKHRALDLGASGYLVKSGFDQESLLDTIAELL